MTAQLATIQQRQQAIGLTPQNIGEAIELANIMSKSGIVPKDYQNNPGNIIVAIQWGAEIGLPPLQAMQNLAVINGRPALWGDAVIAIVRGSGLLESMQEDIGDVTATCTVKRRGEPPVSRTFSMEDAKRAGLAGKQGPWVQYPKRMMQMRARAWALRDVFPDVLRGVHIAEEAQDMPSERDMGPAPVIEPSPASSRTDAVKAKLRKSEQQSPAPAVRLDEVLTAIANASDLEALKAAGKAAADLANGDDKTQAREAYAARKKALETGELSPYDRAVMMIADESTSDGLDEVMDWAKDCDMTDDERSQLAVIAERRLGEIGQAN